MWVYANDKMLYEYFEGKNIFALKWQQKENVKVKDPSYGEEHSARRYEIEINDRIKSFAYFEISNSVELYYIPAENTEKQSNSL